jgi:hypothetical protein
MLYNELQESPSARIAIPEDASRLLIVPAMALAASDSEMSGMIVEALKKDQVILIQGLTPEQADGLMMKVSALFGLADSLEVQAAFASSLGHRENAGKYYMTVNKRKDFQFVCSHSEGGSFGNLQLASFYCHENSTDGGETILMNTNQTTEVWQSLREQVRRGKASRPLTPGEVRRIKMKHRVDMAVDALTADDEILSEEVVDADFSIYEVLAKPKKSYSKILGENLYVYWTDIESLDQDSLREFHQFLAENDLLKLPPEGLDIGKLDDQAGSRQRGFGSDYAKLFKARITHKLKKGEFVLMNNLSWTHAVNNWTPGSGTRKVVAAFA